MTISVLFTSNSARSIALEYTQSKRSYGWVRTYSAGSQPAGPVHPYALKLLEAEDRDTDSTRPGS